MDHAKKRVTGPASDCENMMPSGVLISRALVFIARCRISQDTNKAKPIRLRRRRSSHYRGRPVHDIAIETLPRSRPRPAAARSRNSTWRHLEKLRAIELQA